MAAPRSLAWRLPVALVLAALGGCATGGYANPRDPLERYNRAAHAFNEKVDAYALKPIAEVYRDYVPSMVRTGVRNFFSNLNDIWIGANNLLQGKIENGLSDWMRFAINSTFGLGGLLDVAAETRLEKHNEDLGQTLGWWGVPPGPYFVVPFLGPSTIRDAAGLTIDYGAAGKVRTQIADGVTTSYNERLYYASWGLEFVSNRATALDATNLISGAALDNYTFIRDAYLQRRQSLVYDGSPPRPKDDEDDDDEPEKPAPKPDSKPDDQPAAGAAPAVAPLPDVTGAGAPPDGVDPATTARVSESVVPPGKDPE